MAKVTITIEDIADEIDVRATCEPGLNMNTLTPAQAVGIRLVQSMAAGAAVNVICSDKDTGVRRTLEIPAPPSDAIYDREDAMILGRV